jgi:hopanoid biosynthesis associated RND transporter like protein HpnN
MRWFVLLLQGVARVVCKRPRTVLLIAAVVTLLAGWLSATRLTLVSDQDQLVSDTLPFQKTYLDFIKNFKDQELVYVVIDGRQPERAKAFADDLAARLAHSPDLIQQVTYRVGPEQLGRNMLLYLDLQQVEALSAQVERTAPGLQQPLATGRIDALLDWIGRQFSGPRGPRGPEEAGLAPLFTVMDGLMASLARAVTDGAPYASPFAAFSDDRLSRYTFTDNGRFLLMLINVPKDFSTPQVIERPLAAIRRALDESRAQFPGLEAGVTGRPVLQADEMVTTNRDMTRATIIAVIGVTILFILAFRALWRPLLAVLTLLVSIVWTLGLTAVTIGSLNLLSAVFTLVIVGVGINWGMHLLARYQEERERGLAPDDALQRAMVTAAVGNVTCAATSAAAFLCALFSDFKALAELGFIAGCGIGLSLIAMITVYPALLCLVDRPRRPAAAPATTPAIFHDRLLRLGALAGIVRRPGLTLAIVAAGTLLLAPGLVRIRFDDNLLHLQSLGLESVRWELALVNESRESTWFAATQADTLDEVDQLALRFITLPTVGKVQSLLDVLPVDQRDKQELLARAARALRHLTPRADAPADPTATRQALRRMIDGLELIEEKLFAAGRQDDLTAVRALINRVDQAERAAEQAVQDAGAAGRLAQFQHAFMADLAGQLDRWRPRLTPDLVKPLTLPDAVRDRFIGHNARKLIMITPAQNIWDPRALEAFVTELRTVDPMVTGPPVTSYEAARLMRQAFQQTALLSLGAVLLLVSIHFLRARAVLLTFVPLAIGLLWLLGAMGLMDIPFNLANFFAIPILIGTGIDGGIQMVQRMYEEPSRSMLETSTATSVTLSALTTLLAFGSLVLGEHRGLASLGQIMALGTASILIATVIILPALHELLIRPGGRS